MGKGPEENLQKRIVTAIREKYPEAWIQHIVGNPYQQTGIPDLIMCIEGRLIGIEIKAQRPGESYSHAQNRVSEQQWDQMRRIAKAGGTAGPALSVDEALELVERSVQTGH